MHSKAVGVVFAFANLPGKARLMSGAFCLCGQCSHERLTKVSDRLGRLKEERTYCQVSCIQVHFLLQFREQLIVEGLQLWRDRGDIPEVTHSPGSVHSHRRTLTDS